MGHELPIEVTGVLNRWVRAGSKLISTTPLHLLCEQDFRHEFAASLVQSDTDWFSRPENLQFEKTGNGVPNHRPVDLYYRTASDIFFVEFKYWHTMVKVRDERLELGKGNNTTGDVRSWLNDYDKLLRIEHCEGHRLFLLVSQLSQYPGSSSRLPFDVLESQDKDLSPRRLAARDVVTISLQDGPPGKASALFDPEEVDSPEGVRFGIYGLALRRT